MKRAFWTLSLFLFIPLFANAEVDRHDRPDVKPLRRDGRVAGFKLTLTLRPVQRFKRVRIGLGSMKPPEKPATFTLTNDNWLRHLAAGEQKGYLRVQFPELTGVLKQGQPHEVAFDVVYGKDNDLKAGDEVDVISAWNDGEFKSENHDYWHVFGMFQGPATQNDRDSVVKLPGGEEPTPAPPTPAGQPSAQ